MRTEKATYRTAARGADHVIRIGTAGWNIPKASASAFGPSGTHLQRYARRLNAVEINSSFYRPHRTETYARWASSVPSDFRFAVKLPRGITHDRRLEGASEPLERFLGEAQALGRTLGPLLVQLPPSLVFNERVVADFFTTLRTRFEDTVVCEPRHPSWFTDPVDALLSRLQVARVAADPAVVPRGAVPGGWQRLVYWRLHGAPRVYYSGYGPECLTDMAARLHDPAPDAAERWCIFDNTALGEATHDALALMDRLNANNDSSES